MGNGCIIHVQSVAEVSVQMCLCWYKDSTDRRFFLLLSDIITHVHPRPDYFLCWSMNGVWALLFLNNYLTHLFFLKIWVTFYPISVFLSPGYSQTDDGYTLLNWPTHNRAIRSSTPPPPSWTTRPVPTCQKVGNRLEVACFATWVWGLTGGSSPQTASPILPAPRGKLQAPAPHCCYHLALEALVWDPLGPWARELDQTGRAGKSWDSGSWRRLEQELLRWRRPWGGGQIAQPTGERNGARLAVSWYMEKRLRRLLLMFCHHCISVCEWLAMLMISRWHPAR